MSTNLTTSPPKIDTHLNYQRVIVGLDHTLFEISTEDRLPVAGRRQLLHLLLCGLGPDRCITLVNRLTDLAAVWLHASEMDALPPTHPAWHNLATLTRSVAVEVATATAANVTAYQGHTAGTQAVTS